MIKVLEKYIEIPLELYSFMRNPSMVFIYNNNNSYWIIPFKLYHIPKVITRLVKREEFIIAKRDKIEGNKVYYKISYFFKKEKILNGYRVVNYETKFLLFKSMSDDISVDREQFWKGISNYHEHLKVSDQKEDVIIRTEWLSSIINNYEPKSVLELGCGAGRNLHFIKEKNHNCQLFGVEINTQAVAVAEEQLGNSFKLLSESVYDLDKIESNSIDLVFTSGVLMHIPHDMIEQVVKNLKRISKHIVIHYELHGVSHNFDFHRYPRDYENLYKTYIDKQYEIFNGDDFRNAGTESFNHSLLIVKK